MDFRPLIVSPDPGIRNQSLDAACEGCTVPELLVGCLGLEELRKSSPNLYERVRALFFLHAIHRFHLPTKLPPGTAGRIPFVGYEHLLHRRFEEAIETFLSHQQEHGPGDAISSALAVAYARLAFQTLADQVRRSVRTVRGNQWMFRMGHPKDQPLRFVKPLMARSPNYPILRERTPVRMDLTHSAWSDIFFLGMDFPEGARVLNISVDLGVHGRDTSPEPPVSAWLRVIEEPVLRLVSVDLGARADITRLADVFDFAKDYLGLLKAAVIAAGLVPPGVEGSGHQLSDLLEQMVGPGRGIELVSSVNNIPKGSRLAVSTNLLAALISVCMRATGQASSLCGPLTEDERRLVLARALLGEWLGGSGGGWQDSGGVWPGMKLIEGVASSEGDPEFGISRGRLLPQHTILGLDEISADTRQKLQSSLVVVHGGLAQNVGPILEMVTEKYLLRSRSEWDARQEALTIIDEALAALREGDIRRLGKAMTRNFRGPIQAIIPWASTHYTERLIEEMQEAFGEDFWGFWMLGGMSGGGMGFIFAPEVKARAQEKLQEVMNALRQDLSHSLPFAMDPVVYDFRINEHGTYADLLKNGLMPKGYYMLLAPKWLREDPRNLSDLQRSELDNFGAACRTDPTLSGVVQDLFDALIPKHDSRSSDANLTQCLSDNGFDREAHEALRADLRSGRVGLAQNRLPVTTKIEDVQPEDVTDLTRHQPDDPACRVLGQQALAEGTVAVVSLAAGAASRWTQGAGVVKTLHPFCKLGGRHRTFLETHLAKSRKTTADCACRVPHVFTTSYLTHEPISRFLAAHDTYGPVLSPGRSVGLRTVPTTRDLRFAWEEMPQQLLDAQQQKMLESGRAALIEWAQSVGEATDYTDNLPLQCLHPVGHWFEIPNMLRNGTLRTLLAERPQLKTLLLHNIDTLGANVDPLILGHHLAGGAALTFEVIPRRIEDRGGGLARVNGQPRLIEGLAMPHEDIEFGLTYYNTMTTWIDIDQLLAAFELGRDDLDNEKRILSGIRTLAARVPTYITLKDVKKRWGHGQEDIFPVAQFEKLWSDLTAEIPSRFFVVPRSRGQQLKEQAQLDGWLRDGSAAHVESLCTWE